MYQPQARIDTWDSLMGSEFPVTAIVEPGPGTEGKRMTMTPVFRGNIRILDSKHRERPRTTFRASTILQKHGMERSSQLSRIMLPKSLGSHHLQNILTCSTRLSQPRKWSWHIAQQQPWVQKSSSLHLHHLAHEWPVLASPAQSFSRHHVSLPESC